MAGTCLSVGPFETMLISAMQMCDRIELRKALGDDAERWAQGLAKRETLQGPTLGSLVKILEGHAVAAGNIRSPKRIKDKHDDVVHRLSHDGA